MGEVRASTQAITAGDPVGEQVVAWNLRQARVSNVVSGGIGRENAPSWSATWLETPPDGMMCGRQPGNSSTAPALGVGNIL